ncbi:amino acid ABC transporter [Citrobacter freundii complex sp. CFNIH2]|nr:amino acid ABC transporter [Citrobacter freundii complex sp. CFNIH2]
MHAVSSLRKIPRLSGFHHFYALCHNNYSPSIVCTTG